MKQINLSRRLVLENRQKTPDGAGGWVQSWVPLGTIWAKIETSTGRREAREHADQSVNKVKITTRNAPMDSDARVKPGQRLVEGSNVFLVDAVAETEPHGLYLTCWARKETIL